MKTLIEQQIREMASAKAWKREDIHGKVHEIIVEKAFNSKMVEIFQGSNIDENIETNVCLPQDTN